MTTSQNTFNEQIGKLYSNHHPWLYNWLRKRMGNSCDAADVAHDTFLRLITLRDVIFGLREPRAYLTTTAQRLIIDRMRRQIIEKTYLNELAYMADSLHGFPSPEETLVTLHALEQIATAMANVSVKAREAFLLHYLEGESHATIADQLNVSTRMVHKYLIECLLQCDKARHEYA